jgi:hypothetical protein
MSEESGTGSVQLVQMWVSGKSKSPVIEKLMDAAVKIDPARDGHFIRQVV